MIISFFQILPLKWSLFLNKLILALYYTEMHYNLNCRDVGDHIGTSKLILYILF